MGKDREKPEVCPGCNGTDLKKLISRVLYHVSENDRLESFDPLAGRGNSFCRDPRNIGLGAKKKAKMAGVDLGTKFEEKLDKIRSNPAAVIKEKD
jgi:hypothetical protein